MQAIASHCGAAFDWILQTQNTRGPHAGVGSVGARALSVGVILVGGTVTLSLPPPVFLPCAAARILRHRIIRTAPAGGRWSNTIAPRPPLTSLVVVRG